MQLYIGYVLGEYTDCQVVRSLKHMKKISGNTRDKDYRKRIVETLKESAPIKIKIEMVNYFGM